MKKVLSLLSNGNTFAAITWCPMATPCMNRHQCPMAIAYKQGAVKMFKELPLLPLAISFQAYTGPCSKEHGADSRAGVASVSNGNTLYWTETGVRRQYPTLDGDQRSKAVPSVRLQPVSDGNSLSWGEGAQGFLSSTTPQSVSFPGTLHHSFPVLQPLTCPASKSLHSSQVLFLLVSSAKAQTDIS